MKMRFFIITILFFITFAQLMSQNNDIITINNDIQLIPLHDSVFVHRTYDTFDNNERFSSNGLFIVKNGEAVMIDTPMDNEKTKLLTEYITGTMGISISKVIVCHYHEDCIGGIDFLQSQGIQSIGNSMTYDKCNELGLSKPGITFENSHDVKLNELEILCYYPGGGHTSDNIVVYIPEYKLLFGGCLIKAMGSSDLGNIADADISKWKGSVHKVINKFPNVKVVIPGHGNAGGPELLNNTISLVDAHNNMN
jgi:metallo-beta-lactamase class B